MHKWTIQSCRQIQGMILQTAEFTSPDLTQQMQTEALLTEPPPLPPSSATTTNRLGVILLHVYTPINIYFIVFYVFEIHIVILIYLQFRNHLFPSTFLFFFGP